MKHLVMTFFIAPMLWFTQGNATLQLIQVEPTNIIVDEEIFVKIENEQDDEELEIIPVQGLFVTGKTTWALFDDEKEESGSINQEGWVFSNPDLYKCQNPLNHPMAQIAFEDNTLEECDCGCKNEEEFVDEDNLFSTSVLAQVTFNDSNEDDREEQIVELSGALSNWIKELYRKANTQDYAGKCNCKNKHSDKYFIDQNSGAILINVTIDFDDEGQELLEDESLGQEQVVRIYVEDEKVAEIIFEHYENNEEDKDNTEVVIGYDNIGAYYYNP